MVELRQILLILLVSSVIVTETAYTIPEVHFEALKSGDLRVFVPDVEGTKFLAFHANINHEILQQEPGTLVAEIGSKTDGYWMKTFKQPLKVGDTLHYWIHVNHNRIGYYKLGSWEVRDLLNSFTPLINAECLPSSTTVNGGRNSCIGKLIIDDDFNGDSVDTSKWIVEHKIPTYSGPNYEFNSYKNRKDVRFFKDGALFLKAKAIHGEEEVRGAINLTKGCTADYPDECYYKQASSFLLPPTIGAKIRSKASFKYGKVEVRAKLPAGDWIYPIVELEPKDKIDGENCPKLWIAYSRGNDRLYGTDEAGDLGSRLLFGGPLLHPNEPGRSRALATQRSTVPYSSDYHVYTLEWTPGNIKLYVDSINYGDISTSPGFADPTIDLGSNWRGPDSPFNKEYILSLGVAVGGINDFPDGYHSVDDPKPWLNDDRNYIKTFFDARKVWSKTWKDDNTALQVDYVRVTAI